MISFDQLVHRARSLVVGGNRVLLGITGPPGAGKTTLAEQLIQTLHPHLRRRSSRTSGSLTSDGWLPLADNELARLHRRERKGAPDTCKVGSTPRMSRLAVGV